MTSFFDSFATVAAHASRGGRALCLGVCALLPLVSSAATWDTVSAQAQALSRQAYQPTPPIPVELQQLNYDQMRDIRYRPDRALWRDQQLPFEAMFFHLGLYHQHPVRVHEVMTDAQGQRLSQKIPYRQADYDFGDNLLHPASWGDIGHAGFRLHYPLNTQAFKDELIVFLGASYFRALGAGQQYGLSARGLAVDTVAPSPEEFPRFTDFWLLRPTPGSAVQEVLALLESPRVTGAYRFVIHPGSTTRVDISARVYVRTSPPEGMAPISTLGIAPLTSMFFFGENQPLPGDFRPEVHDSDGLMVATGEGEWIWRPLQNPRHKTVTSFQTTNPKGFGLMQRDRAWSSYEDVEARYERRPSAWVVPTHPWGPGRVELVLLSTPDETHDNVVAYWVPDQLPAPGEPLEFAYQLHWEGEHKTQPPSSWTVQSRRGIGYHQLSADELARQVQFVIDFRGPALEALPADAPVEAVVSASHEARILERLVYRNPVNGDWRLTLRVERPVSDPATTTAPPASIELRAFLRTPTHTLSETWSYVLLPQ
jgi:glucans biosynthesis protein